jgi:dCMP deaminase
MINPVQYFHDIVYRVAKQSTCASRQVGAILVRNNTIILEGWNDPPSKCTPNECVRCNSKNISESGTNLTSALCTHAEANLIAVASGFGICTKDAELWCTTKPCYICAGLISRAFIKEVHYFEEYNSPMTEVIFERSNIKLIKHFS